MTKYLLLIYVALGFSIARAQQFPSTLKDFSDRILHFHSDITVKQNGRIIVREEIRIFNGSGNSTKGYDNFSTYSNDDIKRGIVRDIPTLYKDTSGFWTERGFSVKQVLKNGEKEPYKKQKLNNGHRLMIGRENEYLADGIYDYIIEYETDRQIIFTPEKDELYWNVNGNGWVFTADTVSCLIHFPDKATIGDYTCYTGPMGSPASECKAKKISANEISFINTRKFDSYEGLTVAVAIQKGIIEVPSSSANFLAFIRANYIIPLLIAILIFFITYYFVVWYKNGRDPRKGVIYPQLSPPPGIDAAEAGYILTQKYGSQLFAAALVECAVKKQLNIEVSREGMIFKSNAYTFTRPSNATSVNGDLGFSISSLYGQKAVKGKYNSTLRSAYTALHNDLKSKFLKRRGRKNKDEAMFVLNRGYVIFAVIVVIASIFATIKFLTERPSLKIGIFCAVVLALLVITHLVFRSIMTAYTPKGRQIVDHLLGFKMYLQQAEQRFYNQLTPPEKTLDLFEKYLPFAIALGVENEWAEKFDTIIATAMAAGYQPSYYNFAGHSGGFNVSDFSRGISSGLSSTISSASTPPSSSSSGGGSSGGGGGGGGGGGW
jgi:uncharacterized membrane protein YgcG